MDQTAHGPRAARRQAVGLVVADELFLGRIELSLRLRIQASAAAWQAVCERRMTWELAAGFPPRLDAVEEVPGVGRDVEPRSRLAAHVLQLRLRATPDAPRCRPLSPVSTQPSSPTNRTGQVPSDWTQPGRWPKGVSRQSSTSFTPLA